jgi:hypothetical protein
VAEQRRVLEVDDFTNPRIRALLILSLSTGLHPKVLARPEHHGLTWTNEYYSWNRPKTKRQVQGAWSKAMREGQNLNLMKKWLNRDVSTYRKALDGYCEPRRVAKMNMLRGRHTSFCNQARMGRDPMSIASSTGTSLNVILQYYTIGIHEGPTLSEDDRKFLRWLIDV